MKNFQTDVRKPKQRMSNLIIYSLSRWKINNCCFQIPDCSSKMAEITRSRTPSSGKVENDPSEKEFLVRIQRKNDSSLEEKAHLKLKTRPLRSGNGLQIFLTRQDDPAFYYSVDITNTDYGELQREQGLRYILILSTCIHWYLFNPHWHKLWKQEKCSSLALNRGILIRFW